MKISQSSRSQEALKNNYFLVNKSKSKVYNKQNVKRKTERERNWASSFMRIHLIKFYRNAGFHV